MEEIEKKLKTKVSYYAVDDEKKFKVLAREVFSDGKEVVYPFDREGKPKYKFLQKIVFDGVARSNTKGFCSLNFGYRFTKNLSPLLSFLEDPRFTVFELYISSKEETKFDKEKRILIISKRDLDFVFSQIRPTRDKHSKELRKIVNDFFATRKITKGGEVSLYVPGLLKKFVLELIESNSKLAPSDVDALNQLNDLASLSSTEIKKKYILKTKEEVESIYLDSVLEEFEQLLKQKNASESLEKRWHSFFKKYSWIFTYLFATSVTYFDEEYYVGGQKGNGGGAQYADFIYKNSFTENNTIIEIKTHKTKLLNKSPYRKGTYVFAPSFSLSGSINQVLSQKETLLKEFNAIVNNDFKSYEPKCIVVIGSIGGLSSDERRSLEIFRNNLKGVEIVGFDELSQKIKIIQKLFKENK